MQCEQFRTQLQAYLQDGLDETSRRIWRQHLGACPACRQWATAREPSLLYLSLAPPTADPARVERCTEMVMAQIRQERLQRRLDRPRRRRTWLAAAAAILILLAAAVLWLGGTGQAVTGKGLVAEESGETPLPGPQVEVDMDDAGVRAYYFAENDDTLAGAFVVNPALEL